MAVNESFLDSATLRENVVSLARNIGYVPRSRRSSRARISFLATDLDDVVTLTLRAGIVCNGVAANTSYIFSLPEDITVNVIDGVARFDDIEVYEGSFIRQNFTVNTAQYNQRYILPNSYIDTSTVNVKVKVNQSASTSVTYKQINNIIGITSTSNSYLLQEIEDERYEILFGDGIIGRKLANENYVTVSYITTSGKDGNGAAEFSFVGQLVNQDGGIIDPGNVSLVTTNQPARDGDNIESISSVKYYAPRIYSSQYRAVTASDYEAVLAYIYPNIESVSAYGGEELNPPQFGKVFISAKPRNGDFLSDFTKRDLIQKLKSYSVAGIVPEFIDLKYLYVELQSFVYYNTNFSDDPNNLKTLVSSALTQYSRSIDINKFGGRFKYSKAQTLIDGVNESITSNITRVVMRRNMNAQIGVFAQYELCYGNRFHVAQSSYNVVSTGFKIVGVNDTIYMADEVIDANNGRMFFFTYTDGGTPNVIKRNAGTVKYDVGEIIIDTVNILSTNISNNVIEVQAVPHSNDVIGLRDLYIRLDMTNTSVTMIQDIISSGENTSGSRFIRESSYNVPTYIRKSSSPITSTAITTIPSSAGSIQSSTTTVAGYTY